MRLRDLITEATFRGLTSMQAQDLVKAVFGLKSQTFQMSAQGGANPRFTCVVVDGNRTTFRVKGSIMPATALPSQSKTGLIQNVELKAHFSTPLATAKFKVTEYAEYNDISRISGVHILPAGIVTVVFEISSDQVASVEKSKPVKRAPDQEKKEFNMARAIDSVTNKVRKYAINPVRSFMNAVDIK